MYGAQEIIIPEAMRSADTWHLGFLVAIWFQFPNFDDGSGGLPTFHFQETMKKNVSSSCL
ncbi:hypothetical protein C4D60_Mb11t08760 [Musa balbisiana]|uniref:Uncharacterized protein n=1 Tax=Musa balbisiana TaxID=52838 RepID=A0A4V4H5E1_MUSBA|nr:hypothetical protein C4D60_Mb11t08760 [Musa balbisiana]